MPKSNIAKLPVRTPDGGRIVQIAPPDIRVVTFKLIGTAPYVQIRFTAKAMQVLRDKFLAEAPKSKKKTHAKRDFDEDFKQAQHISTAGWVGVPAGAFRQALISACRLVDFKMTLAKLSIFIEADGFDAVDGIPLVKLTGKPEKLESIVRNANDMPDIRTRAIFREWSLTLRVRYDAAQFSDVDITNLLARVGMQVGIGEGRPDSKQSAGLGWGTFKLESGDE